MSPRRQRLLLEQRMSFFFSGEIRVAPSGGWQSPITSQLLRFPSQSLARSLVVVVETVASFPLMMMSFFSIASALPALTTSFSCVDFFVESPLLLTTLILPPSLQ